MALRNTFSDYSSRSPIGLLSQPLSPILTRQLPTLQDTTTPPLSPFSRNTLFLSSTLGPLDQTLLPINPAAMFSHESLERRLHLPTVHDRPEAFSVKGLKTSQHSRARFQRKRFLVFMKILLKILRRDKSPSGLQLYQYAKAIVSECIHGNRCKDLRYCPLQATIERRLRPIVGEAHWKRANTCLELYLEKRRQLHRLPASTVTIDPLQVSFPEICRKSEVSVRFAPTNHYRA
jgi:hypothetical protein